MIRILPVLAVALALAGCEAPEPPAVANLSNSYCFGVANRRAADAAYNGFSPSIQQATFADAYKDCVNSVPPVTWIPSSAE